MASKTDICNRALSLLGDKRIFSLEDDSVQARACNAIYDECRQSIISSHNWNFATKRARLSRLSEAPLYGYSYQFSLPTSCLRLISVKDDIEYVIEGRNLLCDEDDVYVTYLEDTDNPNIYPSTVREAFSLLMSAKLAYTATQSTSKEQEQYALYQDALSRARGLDAREGKPQSIQPSRWVDAQLGMSRSDVKVKFDA